MQAHPKSLFIKKAPNQFGCFFGYKFWIQVINCVHIND
ncbi:hypothetical protein AO369_1330 [Moraxella catarrhalis]|nr:hypothetical protein AO369_1330 [Moraxella catarrhalis]